MWTLSLIVHESPRFHEMHDQSSAATVASWVGSKPFSRFCRVARRASRVSRKGLMLIDQF
jgi:hypothetical protein